MKWWRGIDVKWPCIRWNEHLVQANVEHFYMPGMWAEDLGLNVVLTDVIIISLIWSNESVCIIPPAEIPTYIREQVSEPCLLLPLPSVDLNYECLMCEFKFLFVYIDHFSVIW